MKRVIRTLDGGRRLLLIAAAIGGAAVAPALAQPAWKPESAVEIIVPSGPGGGTDHTARVVQQILQQKQARGRAGHVVNKTGGGGTLSL